MLKNSKIFVMLIAVIVLLVGSLPVIASTGIAAKIFKKNQNAIIFIKKAKNKAIITGTGFVVDNSGKIITNNHVIPENDTIISSLSGKNYEIDRILLRDIERDLVVIKLKSAEGLEPAIISDTRRVKSGSVLYSPGSIVEKKIKMTKNIVSRVIDIPANKQQIIIMENLNSLPAGLEGGPVFNKNGEVVAILAIVNSRKSINGIYAVSTADLKTLIEESESHKAIPEEKEEPVKADTPEAPQEKEKEEPKAKKTEEIDKKADSEGEKPSKEIPLEVKYAQPEKEKTVKAGTPEAPQEKEKEEPEAKKAEEIDKKANPEEEKPSKEIPLEVKYAQPEKEKTVKAGTPEAPQEKEKEEPEAKKADQEEIEYVISNNKIYPIGVKPISEEPVQSKKVSIPADKEAQKEPVQGKKVSIPADKETQKEPVQGKKVSKPADKEAQKEPVRKETPQDKKRHVVVKKPSSSDIPVEKEPEKKPEFKIISYSDHTLPEKEAVTRKDTPSPSSGKHMNPIVNEIAYVSPDAGIDPTPEKPETKKKRNHGKRSFFKDRTKEAPLKKVIKKEIPETLPKINFSGYWFDTSTGLDIYIESSGETIFIKQADSKLFSSKNRELAGKFIYSNSKYTGTLQSTMICNPRLEDGTTAKDVPCTLKEPAEIVFWNKYKIELKVRTVQEYSCKQCIIPSDVSWRKRTWLRKAR